VFHLAQSAIDNPHALISEAAASTFRGRANCVSGWVTRA
jgi:hypothetical protein